ncbi:MAG: LamG-like jellyroll fold domain-containing protein [Limisphaerales bacterium]
MKQAIGVLAMATLGLAWAGADAAEAADAFDGRFFRGEGDVEYLQLLDISRRMYADDPEFQNLAMLYQPSWNGFVEGPTWGAWWVQNSYGTTYCALPFFEEPFVTFLQNAQDLWFNKMGDGHTAYVWNGKDSWVPPDGCLMDCANETWAMHRQGDGRVAAHDWGMEFTAAGALLQSELLLINRDPAALDRYLPKLERCASFIETRRDPTNHLFLAGAAGNLLAPSFAGSRQPDGTYGMAYLTGLSVTYIAFLDRLIELEKLAGRDAQARLHAERRATARLGLDRLATEEGYFIKYQDPDGTRHGVYGAPKHGYFEASPNHDAICFRVVDEAQSLQIYRRMAAIPGLRPCDLIIANHPSLDDMYEAPQGLWGFGTWVNGGHWTTCEARMMMAYYRVGQQDDARRSMQRILSFARRFRMDNPLVKFGSEVYQPGEPINLTYDAFGAPAALIRGLFEYLYRADGLTLVPQIPSGIDRLEQKFPIRFGNKRLFLAVQGRGPITGVRVNGEAWTSFDARSVFLPYATTPEVAAVQVIRGGAAATPFAAPAPDVSVPGLPRPEAWPQPKPVDAIAANDLPLRIGADSQGGSRFRGDLARVWLFRRALDTNEIAALAQSDPGPLLNDPALLARWIFTPTAEGTFPNAAGPLPAAKAVGRVDSVDSRFGATLRLEGEGYLEIPTSPAINLAKGGTLYVLVRPDTTQGRLLDKCPVGGATGFTFDTHPGNALRLISDSGSISYDAKLAPGEWVHLAATVDAAGNSFLYLNGKAVAAGERKSRNADLPALLARVGRVQRFHEAMSAAGLSATYEAAHARLAVRCLATTHERLESLVAGRLARLPDRSQTAADQLYLNTVARLCEGLEKVLNGYADTNEAPKQRIHELWKTAGS